MSLARSLAHPAALLIAIMPLQWMPVAEAAGLSLRVAYLGIIGLVVFAAASQRMRQACFVVIRDNALWLLPFGLYLMFLTLVLYGSPAQNMAPRQIFFLMGAICLSAFIVQDRTEGKVLRAGGAASIILFILLVEWIARNVGLSWLVAIERFFASGDLDFIVYGFFRAVFNAFGPEEELAVRAAAKNAVSVTIFVACLLIRIGYCKPSPDWVGIGFTGLALLLIVFLNTRSVLVVAVASLLLVLLLRSATSETETPAILVAKCVAVAMAAVGILFVAISDHPVIGMLSDRFAFADDSTGDRVAQYGWAFQEIERNPLLGNGYMRHDGRIIHNLFVGAWLHAGILAFLLVVSFYLAIVGAWLSFVVRIVRNPTLWVLRMPFEWVAVLPILPLFRVWLSGDAGHPALGEWIAIAAFFGLVLRNRMETTWMVRISQERALDDRPIGRRFNEWPVSS